MKTVGILGGMGSMATVDLFGKIVRNTKVARDQDHLHVIIDNYPQIPDRTDYILKRGLDPTDKMIEAAKRLEEAGADILAMPCNTAHYFYDRIQASINIPIIHMMKETKKRLKSEVVLLATEGTYAVGLYKDVLIPNDTMKKDIMTLIYTYKKDQTIDVGLKEKVLNQLDYTEGIILGCTELPLIFKQEDTPIPLIDPTQVLAEEIIVQAGAKLI
ncbi:amino acid racemase [Acidaminobacter sp. JC074]|uniref:aspartate/glutamate racemase family protein n=1 Tax=Acidaminobacter sp. JC074 TaxID=2530199 RepID=UPI001F0F0D7E|nr:amino acid racemase [Acidaminobacter sp. JC074]MCH4887185.1 amino acid racemase [Acidaminobacter sp. JC074]